jgi:hypothetical protein
MGKCFNCALLIVYACDLSILVPQMVYCLHSQFLIYMYANYCCVGHLIVRIYQSLYFRKFVLFRESICSKVGGKTFMCLPSVLKSRYPNAPSGKLRDPRAQSAETGGGFGEQASYMGAIWNFSKETGLP